jgi:hypothetical protein
VLCRARGGSRREREEQRSENKAPFRSVKVEAETFVRTEAVFWEQRTPLPALSGSFEGVVGSGRVLALVEKQETATRERQENGRKALRSRNGFRSNGDLSKPNEEEVSAIEEKEEEEEKEEGRRYFSGGRGGNAPAAPSSALPPSTLPSPSFSTSSASPCSRDNRNSNEVGNLLAFATSTASREPGERLNRKQELLGALLIRFPRCFDGEESCSNARKFLLRLSSSNGCRRCDRCAEVAESVRTRGGRERRAGRRARGGGREERRKTREGRGGSVSSERRPREPVDDDGAHVGQSSARRNRDEN